MKSWPIYKAFLQSRNKTHIFARSRSRLTVSVGSHENLHFTVGADRDILFKQLSRNATIVWTDCGHTDSNLESTIFSNNGPADWDEFLDLSNSVGCADQTDRQCTIDRIANPKLSAVPFAEGKLYAIILLGTLRCPLRVGYLDRWVSFTNGLFDNALNKHPGFQTWTRFNVMALFYPFVCHFIYYIAAVNSRLGIGTRSVLE